MTLGITLVSHSPAIPQCLVALLKQVAANVAVTTAGGTQEDELGTSFDKILAAFEQNPADEILAFYNLGSAKMNFELACEMTTKTIHIYDIAFIEGAYSATALLQADVSLAEIEEQLAALKIK